MVRLLLGPGCPHLARDEGKADDHCRRQDGGAHLEAGRHGVDERLIGARAVFTTVLSMNTISMLTDMTARTNHLRLEPRTEETVVVVATCALLRVRRNLSARLNVDVDSDLDKYLFPNRDEISN